MYIIDSHVHVIEPARFPYAPEAWCKPIGAEIGTAQNLHQVLDAHGISKALLVGTNSGHNTDNRCMLDAIAQMQVQHDQLLPLHDMLVDSGAKLLFDHCGRPDPTKGVEQADFAALLVFGGNGQSVCEVVEFE